MAKFEPNFKTSGKGAPPTGDEIESNDSPNPPSPKTSLPPTNETNDNLKVNPREAKKYKRMTISVPMDFYNEFIEETIRRERGKRGSQINLILTMWEIYKKKHGI